MTTRAVAYLRVSSEKQAETGISLEAQEAKVRAYAQLYEVELVSIETDAGISAKSLNRPSLTKALSMLETGKANALLVVKLDRLTRSVKDLGILLDLYFASGKFALLSVGEQIDTRSAAGRLVLNVLASVAQWEREATGERTAAVLAHKRSLKEYTGGKVPYGWKISSNAVNIEPHNGEQQIIQAALELKKMGLSLRKVGERLEELGLLPRSGKLWHAKTVQDLLNAELAS